MPALADTINVRLRNNLPLSEEDCLELGGLKAYVCSPAQPFDNGDLRRVGWLFLTPRPGARGATVNVFGARLLSDREDGRHAFREPVTWTGTGEIRDKNQAAHFTYRSDSPGSRGVNDDDFLLSSGEVWPGTFSHKEAESGREVFGNVELSSIVDGELPDVIKALDLRLRQLLPLEVQGEWGRRLFNELQPWKMPDADSNTDALIDIVRGTCVCVTIDTIAEAASEMRKEFPNCLLFRMPLDGKIPLTLG